MKAFAFLVSFLASVVLAAAGEHVVLSYTNATPSNPTLPVSWSLVKGNSYTVNITFQDVAGTAMTITGRTVALKWQLQSGTARSEVYTEAGTASSNGLASVTIDPGDIKTFGDHLFEMSATNSNSAARVFWTSRIYEGIQ